MNKSSYRVASVLRALRYAATCLAAEAKIPARHIPGGIRWDIVAIKFGTYTRANMRAALGLV